MTQNKTWIDYYNEGKTISDLTKEEIKELKENEELWILKEPLLLKIINQEFDKFIVDEEATRKAIFICCCGCFVENLSATFNILVNGESSAGKSWITKNILQLFPENIFSKETYRTRISPKALTYWHNSEVEPEWTWNGKILYLEDIGSDILNSDVFKVMVSEGSTATIVGKHKGKGVELPTAIDIEIVGKPITIITTAIGVPIEEIKNRFLLIDLDESEDQTKKIMERQAQISITGKKEKYAEIIKESLSKLKRVEVLIPEWVSKIVEYMPRKDVLRWRREFPRFLEIIKCSAALHQYQREKIRGKIIANEQDYEIARDVIGKIAASSGIEGLTHREKNAYEIIKKFYEEHKKGCTKSEIRAFNPIYSDRGWEKMINKLSEKKLLSLRLETNPDTNRKVFYYYPIELHNLQLPDFKILTEQNELIKKTHIYIHRARELDSNNVSEKSFKISSVSSNRRKCPECDLNVHLEDWNEKKGTCIFCNPKFEVEKIK